MELDQIHYSNIQRHSEESVEKEILKDSGKLTVENYSQYLWPDLCLLE